MARELLCCSHPVTGTRKEMKNTYRGRGKWKKRIVPLCRPWLEHCLGKKYLHWKDQKNHLSGSDLSTREYAVSPSSTAYSKHLLSCLQPSYLASISSSSLLPVSKHGFDSHIDPSIQHLHALHLAP